MPNEIVQPDAFNWASSGATEAEARRVACLERMATALEETGDFRVLRKLPDRTEFDILSSGPRRTLVALDVETTGLDAQRDQIIELAMVKAEYNAVAGTICRVIDTFSELQQPSGPLPSEIVQLTGITDAMVKGQVIDPEAVSTFVDGAALIVAHNAKFDRAFAERYWPIFEHFPWACSATQVDWRGFNFENARLSALLAGIGFFHPAHRALNDCHAMLHLLAHRPNGGPQAALSFLLDAARRKSRRIWALQAPYQLKDHLKQRKYNWNDGSDGRPKSWFIDVEEHLASSEADFLRSEIYGYDADIKIEDITAFTRFSCRGERG